MRSRASSECRLHSTSMTWAFSNPVKRTGTARWLHEAAQQATRTIPIVADFQDDPVATGLISGLAGPGDKSTKAVFHAAQLIEHADMIPEAKRALFDVLARLTSQIPDLGLDDMSWRQDHGIFFRCQTAPLKYSYMLGGMFSSCACAMCLRTVSEYWKRSPQMRQCHWSRAKMYGRHSGLFGSSLGLGIFKSCKKNRNRALAP
jgi:hypothetical protein